MNVLGIIVEYNPMHNGHVYHIQQAKKLTNSDYVIAIMSGSFTEQGNIGIFNKFDRAQLAIQNGVDMVIELPTLYATSSSENFAFGAINILNSLDVVTHIAFGAECDDINTLESVAYKLNKHEHEILSSTKELMKSGISSINAKGIALKKLLTEDEYLQIDKPNNLLGISYTKALYQLKSQIKPVLVKRVSSNHGDLEVDKTSTYASSTSIRSLLSNSISKNDLLNEIESIVPRNTYELFKEKDAKLTQIIWPCLKYEILKIGKEGIKRIYEVSEGLENRIYECGLSARSYNEFIEKVKSKRYTLGRIKRIAIYILLGISKEKYINLNGTTYARILKVNKDKKDLISLINRTATIPVITNVNDKIIDLLPEKVKQSLTLDILATNLSEVSTNNSNLDYTNML